MAQGAKARSVGPAPGGLRSIAIRYAFVLAAWLAVFGALQTHLGLLAIPPLGFLLLPVDWRAELLLAALEGWPEVLADLLAVVAATAVGYAAGDAVRPVVAWAIPAIAVYRTVSVRASERLLAPIALLVGVVAWGTGRMPPEGDGALAALLTLAAPAVLGFLPRPGR